MIQCNSGLNAALSLLLGAMLGAGAVAVLTRPQTVPALKTLPASNKKKNKSHDDDAPLFI